MAAPEGRRAGALKVCFFASEKRRERLLADAFMRGLKAHGDTGFIQELDGEAQVADAEVAVMVGVKSREIFQANWQAGVHTVMIDKGYTRHRLSGPVKIWEYWRVAVDGHHPTRTLMATPRRRDRLKALCLPVAPWRRDGGHILIAGSSAKYHRFYGLDDPTSFSIRLVRRLHRLTNRRIVYRPKPSWKEAVPIRGTEFSAGGQDVGAALKGAWAMVTHGSNACFEAALSGVPSIVLGDAVAKPISSTEIGDVVNPYLAPNNERRQWLANLAYCQWTMHEFESGAAWAVIRPQIYG